MKHLDRRGFLLGSLAGAGSMVLGACRTVGQAGAKRKKKPLNFLFVLVDDLGWRDLGCFGSKFYETPHIDALRARGMKFTQAYAACPVCSPTRASIMAGKYPARMDTTDWFGAAEPEWILSPKRRRPWRMRLIPAHYVNRLPLEEVTLAEAFKEAGYATFFAGKWHLGPKGFYPEDQGFDINKGGWVRGGPYGPGKYFVPYGNPKLEDGPPGEYLPFRLAKETVKFIDEHKDRPFLAYLAFYSVHIPLMTKKGLEAKYAAKAKEISHKGPKFGKVGRSKWRLYQDHPVYGGMVEAVDIAVGRVLDALDRNGLGDNTVVIFMSDNGGLATAQGWPTSNLPLKAGKGWLYEGGIREPMIIVWPGVTEPGSVCDTPVISTDFYPTMLEMAGLPLKPKQHVDGVSLVPLLKGGKIPPRPLFWHYPHYGDQGGRPGSVIRKGDWKLIEFFEDGRLELYNLRKDIGEKHDLSKKYPEKVKELHAELVAWRKKVGAKLPTPNPNWKPRKRRR